MPRLKMDRREGALRGCVPPAAPLGRGGPFLASGGPLRPGVAKLEGVALRCKGLLRKKDGG